MYTSARSDPSGEECRQPRRTQIRLKDGQTPTAHRDPKASEAQFQQVTEVKHLTRVVSLDSRKKARLPYTARDVEGLGDPLPSKSKTTENGIQYSTAVLATYRTGSGPGHNLRETRSISSKKGYDKLVNNKLSPITMQMAEKELTGDMPLNYGTQRTQ